MWPFTLRRLLLAILGFVGMALAVDREAIAEQPMILTAPQILELMFPAGSPYESMPVIKWSHVPRILVIADSSVSAADVATVKRILADIASKVGIFAESDVEWRVPSDQIQDEDLANGFIIVLAEDGVQQSNGRYRKILDLTVANESQAQKVSDAAIENHREAMTRFGIGLDGQINHSICILNSDSRNPAKVQTLLSAALLAGFSPTAQWHNNVLALLEKGEAGQRISAAGYEFLQTLYSKSIAPGLHRQDVERLLN